MFSEHCATYLRERGRVLAPWSYETLARWLEARRAPLFKAHLSWEEAMARVAEHARPASAAGADFGGGLIEVEEVRFGAVGLAEHWPEWTVERHDGEAHVLIAVSLIGWSRRFYIREDGSIFLRQGLLWRAVAASPFVYLERMAARDVTARSPLMVEVSERVGPEIAAALGIAKSTSASDPGQRCWTDGHACVLEGAWDRAAEPVTTVYLGALSVARDLLAVAEVLDVSLRVESSAPSTIADMAVIPLHEVPAGAQRAIYSSPSELCSGLVTYETPTRGERLVQIVRQGQRVIEQASFSGIATDVYRAMSASKALGGELSPCALAYLNDAQFLRDPRHTCRSETLAELLARYRLPATDHALAFEARFGRLLQDPRVGGFRFGIFDMLTVQRATGQYGGPYETEHEPVLQLGEDWPRVRWQDK